MGRGLSELQKTMLDIAYRGWIQGRDTCFIDLSLVATVFYGWNPKSRDDAKVEFSKKNIPNYNSGKVSIYKAIHRLQKRGLVYYLEHKSVYIISQKGRDYWLNSQSL